MLAFERTHENRTVIAVTTRLGARLDGVKASPLVAPSAWQGTAMILPRNFGRRGLSDVLGGPGRTGAGGRVMVAEILASLPVALLEVQ